MNLNPPWSQPICQACYIARFKVPCKVFGDSRHAQERCIDCNMVIDCGDEENGGIYIDTRVHTGGVFNPPTTKEKAEFEMKSRLAKRSAE